MRSASKKQKKRLTGLGALLVVLFTVFTADGDSAESAHDVSVKQGQDLTINLRSNPSTGYRWSAKFDKDFLHLKKESFTRSDTSLPGSPGQQTFVFITKKTGVTDIEFVYSRSWEKVFAERSIYRVTISK